jgi:hypothetical protein
MRSGKVRPTERTQRKPKQPLRSDGASSPTGKRTSSQFTSKATGSSRRS